MRGPGHPGLGNIIGGFSGHRRDINEMVTLWTLDLPPGELFLALQVLVAVGAGEFELAHNSILVRCMLDDPFSRFNRRNLLTLQFGSPFMV